MSQLSLNQEQQMLQDQVRSLCGEQATPDLLRGLITEQAPWSQSLWATMAELGLPGAAIPEEKGGVGLGIKELCVIAEELGRAPAPVPFFSSACMAAEAIKLAGSDEQQRKWLPQLASGEKVATLAHAAGSGSPDNAADGVLLSADQLSGTKSPVADLSISDWVLVVASENGYPVIALVDVAAAAPEISPLHGFDELRHHGELKFHQTPCEVLTGNRGTEVVDELFCRLAVISAFEQIGGAEAAMLMARDYTMERFIFGRQLASYQAVKHKLADILAMVEINRSNAMFAAAEIEAGRRGRLLAAATARVGATALYEEAARENLQLHGGIGFTWEANCHFHYRRARLLAQHLGGPAVWQRVLVEQLKEKAA